MDVIKKFMLFDKTILVSVISAKELVDKAIKIHSLSRTAAAALGRTLIVGAYMGTELKDDKQKLSITINGGGPLGRIVVLSDFGAKVRGYVENPAVELPLNGKGKLDVGGGVGCAIAYPVLKKFHDCGAEVHAVVGFKNKDVVILEDKFKSASDVMKLVTDDGSYGEKGLVTDALKQLIEEGNQYDEIFAIGPAIMMKFVSKPPEPYGIPPTVSMSPIMIDGTGMCGGCRLTVNGETKFACVDGPDFDGHKVDWDESLKRGKMYFDWERHKHEEVCNLFKKEVQ